MPCTNQPKPNEPQVFADGIDVFDSDTSCVGFEHRPQPRTI